MRTLQLATLFLAVATQSRGQVVRLNETLGLAGVTGEDQTFDYVIVGGGTGGLTIAERLAEDKTVTVAVVEAGTLYEISDPIAQVPSFDSFFVGKSEVLPSVDWGFFTAPDPATGNVARSYARGKCLGGR